MRVLDVDDVIRRVDIDAVVKRVDVDDVVRRVDVDDIVQRIDIDAIVRRTEVGSLIVSVHRRGGGGDAGRGPEPGGRARSVRPAGREPGPAAQAGRAARRTAPTRSRHARRSMSRVEDQTLEGHYAGVISRLLAWVLDSFLAVSLYGLVVSAAVFVWNVTVRRDLEVPTEDSLAWVIGLVAWIAFYFAGSWALWGKTVGKAVVGLRIVRRDGGDLEPGRALRRAIVFPVDFLTLGIGFAVGARRPRAPHVPRHAGRDGGGLRLGGPGASTPEPPGSGGQAAGVRSSTTQAGHSLAKIDARWK